MERVDAPEILDSDACSPSEVHAALKTLGRINRWFGGVRTTQKLVERVARASGRKTLSLLEVASGTGEVPIIVRQRLARHGNALSVTLLDRASSHLRQNHSVSQNGSAPASAVTADALALPFSDDSFDLVSCNLFAHHLSPQQMCGFVEETLRVSRVALLINDLVRHPLHLALVYASFPIMGSRIAWQDGLTSVRRSYIPEEMRGVISSAAQAAVIEISRHYLFRMGMIVWKKNTETAR
jgi:ubiquinone/menaquinone biosynthesis C-methylase UbiE